jgi:hypothetical protein
MINKEKAEKELRLPDAPILKKRLPMWQAEATIRSQFPA